MIVFRYYLRRVQYWSLFSHQKDLYLATVVATLSTLFGSVSATQNGRWWILPIGMLLISPISMYILRRWWEDNWPPLFNKLASRAFMYGDTVVLPIVFGCAGYGWQKVPMSDWMRSYSFAIICLVIGYISAFIFRLVDGKRYTESSNEAMLYCPTKVWHDMAVFPVMVALLVWLLLPQLITTWSSIATVTALIFLLQFVLLVVVDLMDPPDPESQHVRWDKEEFRKIPISF